MPIIIYSVLTLMLPLLIELIYACVGYLTLGIEVVREGGGEWDHPWGWGSHSPPSGVFLSHTHTHTHTHTH